MAQPNLQTFKETESTIDTHAGLLRRFKIAKSKDTIFDRVCRLAGNGFVFSHDSATTLTNISLARDRGNQCTEPVTMYLRKSPENCQTFRLTV